MIFKTVHKHIHTKREEVCTASLAHRIPIPPEDYRVFPQAAWRSLQVAPSPRPGFGHPRRVRNTME